MSRNTDTVEPELGQQSRFEHGQSVGKRAGHGIAVARDQQQTVYPAFI